LPSVSVQAHTPIQCTCLRCLIFLFPGSLFNHSDSPNVSYSIDAATESIQYKTTRAVEPDEEFFIYYGSNLWFEPINTCSKQPFPYAAAELVEEGEDDDGWGGLSAVAPNNHVLEHQTPDPNEILPDDDVPFTRVKLTSDEDDEETMETVRTGEHVPRLGTRLLMPNTSTGMGGRHTGPPTHDHSAKVHNPTPTPSPPI
jgi:SET domain